MVAKRNDNTARARRVEQHEERTALSAIDGDASMPMALDRLIHERVRLAIVSALAVHESLTFNELKALLDTSDGNVSVHARKLEDAGYITCTKGFEGRVPRTEYALTTDGRRALEGYLSHMEALIKRVGGA
jgi:DNA-binding transcriptional ArsR family regulator